MGFLDNSGDIILDAVLTDAGRQRLARADGSFKIAQFALGDDEINYALYDKTNSSGSAYYDLSILQTPVFEAFTNNIASLNSKLLTITRNDILFLPIIKPNNKINPFSTISSFANTFIVLVDSTTETDWKTAYPSSPDQATGVFLGSSLTDAVKIRLDQGIDNSSIPQTSTIDADMKETQYSIEIDNKLGIVHSPNDSNASSIKDAVRSFVDDDGIAQYYLSFGTDADYVKQLEARNSSGGSVANMVIAGPVGTSIEFKVRPTLDLSTSTYLFNLIGTSFSAPNSKNFKIIKSNVVVTGLTTGYSVSIPINYVKSV